MDTTVRLENFTGPLDLLLHLVRLNEVDIHDIPVAQIAEQYLRIIEAARDLDMEIAGEFLLMAATLAEIKSRRLAPAAPGEEEEETGEDEASDPRMDLIKQLLRFRYYKERASLLENLMRKWQLRRGRPDTAANVIRSPLPKTRPDREILDADPFTLAVLFKRLEEQIRPSGNTVLHYDDIPVEEKIEEVIAALREKNRVLFDDLVRNHSDPIEIVTTLSAILELVKQRLAAVRQLEGLPSIVILRPEDAPAIKVTIPERPDPPEKGPATLNFKERKDPLAEEISQALSRADTALKRLLELKKNLENPSPAHPDEQSIEHAAEEILSSLTDVPVDAPPPPPADAPAEPPDAAPQRD